MSTNDTRLALSEVQGPLIDLLEKVGGRDGELWLRGLNKFLRKENPWEKGIFWTIEIGTYKDVGSLRKALGESDARIGNWAGDILSKIKLNKFRQSLELVAFTVEELGYPDGAQLQKIYKAADNQGLDECPAEAAAYFLLQHGSELKPDKILIFAMEPIKGSDGVLSLFDVKRHSGGLWLDARCGRPGLRWDASTRFVFVRRK